MKISLSAIGNGICSLPRMGYNALAWAASSLWSGASYVTSPLRTNRTVQVVTVAVGAAALAYTAYNRYMASQDSVKIPTTKKT